MNKTLLVIFTLVGYFVTAQSITSAEYFYDTDPGVGNGTTLTVNANTGDLSQTFSLATGSLDEGFHSLYVRTLNSQGYWSLYDRHSFYLSSFNSYNITTAEYFFNTDPGIGNGISLAVDANTGTLSQTFVIPTTDLSEGFHSLYLRTQSTSGKWSLYDRQAFYIKTFDVTPDEIVSAEYFVDTDSGIGNGTPITFENTTLTSQTFAVNTNELAEGDHLLYVRVQDENGDWSIYDTASFTIDSNLNVEDSLFKSTNIYPNPFIDTIKISSKQNITITSINIYDFVGKTVYHSTTNLKYIDLSFLLKGVYILELKTNDNKASFKIVKE